MRFNIETEGVSVSYAGFGRNRRRMREVALLAIEMVQAQDASGRDAVIDAALEMIGVPDDASEL